MPEQYTPQNPMPPQGQIVDQAFTTHHEFKLGGNRQGGEYEHSLLDIEPLSSAEHGFKIGELPANLEMAMLVGNTMLGVVKTRLVGQDSDTIMLARLEGDSDSGFKIPNDPDNNNRPMAIGIGEGKLLLGRDDEKNSPANTLLHLSSDSALSSRHMSIEVGTNQQIVVKDLESLNGTTIFTTPKSEVSSEFEAGREVLNDHRAQSAGDVAVHDQTKIEFQSPDEKLRDTLERTIEESNAVLKAITEQVDDKDDLVKLWDFGVKSGHYREVAHREEKNPSHLGHRYVEHAYADADAAERKLPNSVKPFAPDYRTHMVNKMLAQMQLDDLQLGNQN